MKTPNVPQECKDQIEIRFGPYIPVARQVY